MPHPPSGGLKSKTCTRLDGEEINGVADVLVGERSVKQRDVCGSVAVRRPAERVEGRVIVRGTRWPVSKKEA